MPVRLILIRHAKSAWDDPLANDHARVLNDRGRRSATAIGQWLATKGYLPGECLCSDASRTRETWDLIAAELPAPAPVQHMPELYHAGSQRLLSTLRNASADTVALVAHNPGIGDFASGLLQRRSSHPRYADYPTGATAVIDFDLQGWEVIAPRSGSLTDFVVPRDLIDA